MIWGVFSLVNQLKVRSSEISPNIQHPVINPMDINANYSEEDNAFPV